jgi:hypothetical protein
VSAEQKPTVAFVLSLIGGVFILLGGGMMSMFNPYGLGEMMRGYSGNGGYGGMMNGYSGYGGNNGNGWFGGMMNGYSGYGGYSGNGWYGGMMGRYLSSPGFGMMGGFGYGFGGIFGLAGIVFGIVVIVSSAMLFNKPIEHSKWGLLILIFSVLSIFGSAMAGFGVGLILGVLGGIFALTWKPPTTSKT